MLNQLFKSLQTCLSPRSWASRVTLVLLMCSIMNGAANAQQTQVGISFGLSKGLALEVGYLESGFASGWAYRAAIGLADVKSGAFGVQLDAYYRSAFEPQSPESFYAGVGIGYDNWGGLQSLQPGGLLGLEFAVAANSTFFIEVGAAIPFLLTAPTLPANNATSVEGAVGGAVIDGLTLGIGLLFQALHAVIGLRFYF